MKPKAQALRPQVHVNGAGRVAGDPPCTPVSAVTGTPPGWQAGLELTFAPRCERTALVHRLHHGPLMVQKPFWPEGAPCHVYLLHPPGGVAGGDSLHTEVRCAGGAHALLTSPAATKLYRALRPAAVSARLQLEPGASLEWLPQETIAFERTQARLATRVDLARDTHFIGWEVLCLGRPAAGEGFDSGEVAQHLEVWRDGRPLFVDRLRAAGGAPLLAARWGLGGHAVTGTMLAAPADDDLLQLARGATTPTGVSHAASVVDGLLVVRALAGQTRPVLAAFNAVWRAIRPALLGRPASPPRIWAT